MQRTVNFGSGCLLLLVVAVACSSDRGSPAEPSPLPATLAATSPVAGGSTVMGGNASGLGLIELCHVTGSGRYDLLHVDASATAAHLAHGDGQPGGPVPTDPALIFDNRCRVLGPALEIEKATNGEDADRGSGPVIAVGDPIMWTYRVTNTGDVALTNITVVDDDPSIGLVCAPSGLVPGESVECLAGGMAAAGRYANVGTATGDFPGGSVTDSDASRYVGQDEAPDDADHNKQKVDLCHRTGRGRYNPISVSVDAEPAHIAHGDGYPGQSVPGDPSAIFDAGCVVLAAAPE